jgi:CheY-like chemotaxis protein
MPKSDLILLALDDSPVLSLMDRALRVKYETAVARDTRSLALILQESVPALMLVGEKFNGRDGTRIADELHERFPTLPILLYLEKAKLRTCQRNIPPWAERVPSPSAENRGNYRNGRSQFEERQPHRRLAPPRGAPHDRLAQKARADLRSRARATRIGVQ